MKVIVLGLSLASLALAHGPKSQQASDAIKVATLAFQKSVAPEVAKRFVAVSALHVGHEQFKVEIATSEPAVKLAYDCKENELVDPVVWECKAMSEDEE